jgi:hypothetical protein
MTNKKDYMLFIGEVFYPQGGWGDFVGYYSCIEQCLSEINSIDPAYKWAHIVFENKIIYRYSGETTDCRNHYWVKDND